MALSTKMGRLKASFAVDTSAAVNVLSEKAYLALKRASRGSQWPLRPNDLNLMGVTSEPLNILGIIRLPISLGKGTSIMRLDLYVASNFSLPTDGLLGLKSLKSNRMVIHPDINMIKFQGKGFQAMNQPMRLNSECGLNRKVNLGTLPAQTQAVPALQNVSSTQKDNRENWKVVNATVLGDHEIPHRVAMHIPVGPSQSYRRVLTSALKALVK
ncbi:hypothetical protein GWK47_029518 [Chionoecetes opilio]|uniref:Uncharacterized protein n=1 Tax=Chionoecetes opilio TaxID=41210 RepID=A0A8J4YLF4_CHIOP|nr:hypothetical protein GWK47_029518 [Chionoecetes opilio]